MDEIQREGVPEKRDWEKIVANSNGKRVMFPESMRLELISFIMEKDAIKDDQVKLSERVCRANNTFDNIAIKFRDYMVENHLDPMWMMDISLDEEALKDGVYIMNFYQGHTR